MKLVERHIITKNHPLWSEIDQKAFLSKNLFNLANYHYRQHFFAHHQKLNFNQLYHLRDDVPKYGAKKPVFQGHRIARGLYKTAKGRLLNADVNGSFNITRKVIPDVLDQGIKGLPFNPVMLDPRAFDWIGQPLSRFA
ncbi:hypothetical protein [Aerosakkonema funiforme]|uniref:Transposase n=1 Tax=Aerosakkonema funiforme FACHB-1375 TaxID=2949571 RepID=A0A926ZKL9_9CYAN|nr:hypothetical protein [Aerosakkonema funiforme]MBD2186125.1 hypothetical protein [Aerosakkonema funiforme FACHB-1375]